MPREQEKEPLGYYNERIYSVEVIKDDHLQKIYFPVARRVSAGLNPLTAGVAYIRVFIFY